MNILSPKEFKEKHKIAMLEDYIKYLEEEYKKGEQALKDAQNFSLGNEIEEEIKTSINEIVKFLSIIEKDMTKIVLKTIDQLSLEELKDFFHEKEEFQTLEKKKIELQEEQTALEKESEKIKQRLEKTLHENGRSKEFYEKEDTSLFFAPNKTNEEFMNELLEGKITVLVENKLYHALNREFIIKKEQESVTEEKEVIILQQLVRLLKKCQRILLFAPSKKTKIIRYLLSKNGIGKILEPYFKENEYERVIRSFVNASKTNTYFYMDLPQNLKKQLIREGFEGAVYQHLLQTYQQIKEKKEIDARDLCQEEYKRLDAIKERIQSIKKEIEMITTAKTEKTEFYANEEVLRSALKEQVTQYMKEDTIPYEELNKAIETCVKTTKQKKEHFLKVRFNLTKEEQNLPLVQEILMSPEYVEFFRNVEKKNRQTLWKVTGVTITEKVLEPFLKREQRRLEQMKIIIDAENKLETLECERQKLEKTSSFIEKMFPSYKRALEQLNRKSDKEARNYSELEVEDFSQDFWDFQTGITENTKQRFLEFENEGNFDNWDNYIRELTSKQQKYVNNLLQSPREVDYQELLNCQERLVAIILSSYNERKALREELEEEIVLDQDKIKTLESILGKGTNLSRESLAIYIKKAQKSIKELKEELLTHKSFVQSFGILLPEEEKNHTIDEERINLEQVIQNLEIEGINTLTDAILYRAVLEQLNDYKVGEEKIKSLLITK